MTGYAMEAFDQAAGSITLEVRSVNSRFLDLSFKMGEDFRVLEPQMRERISAAVRRGKLECRVNVNLRKETALAGELNETLLQQLADLAVRIQQAIPNSAPLQTGEILRWPGLLGDSTPDADAMQQAVLAMLERALVEFNASRAREGDKLRGIILERVVAMRGHVTRLRPMTPAIVLAYREKLGKRMEELLPAADNERLMQEVALFAQKIDIDEELDRLESHLAEVERVLKAGGSTGKRLDFLMQELNREANTLGSKAATLDLSQTSVELKVLIEQIREQVQNLE